MADRVWCGEYRNAVDRCRLRPEHGGPHRDYSGHEWTSRDEALALRERLAVAERERDEVKKQLGEATRDLKRAAGERAYAQRGLEKERAEAGRLYREAEGQKRRADMLDERCVELEKVRDVMRKTLHELKNAVGHMLDGYERGRTEMRYEDDPHWDAVDQMAREARVLVDATAAVDEKAVG